MTDALVPSPDVAALEGLPVNEIDEAVGVAWQSFGRRTVVDAWHLGRALRRVKDGRGRHFAAYCEGIGMSRSWAYDLLKIAGGSLSKLSGQRTIAGAVKALKAASSEAPSTPPPAPTPTPAPAHVEEADTDPEAALEEVGTESQPDPRDVREERLERFAIRTEDVEGDVVDGWMAKYERQAVREREHVRLNREQAKREQAKDRKDRAVCDAALCLPPSPELADFLARFWGVAQKAKAAA